jgi:hypothetical protein
LKKKFFQYQSINHKSHNQRPTIYRRSHGTVVSTADQFHLCSGSDRTWTIHTEVYPWFFSVHPDKFIDFFVLKLPYERPIILSKSSSTHNAI